MKKIIFLLFASLVFGLFSCNEDGSDAGLNDNSESVGGSLATFILKDDYLYVVDQNNLNVFSLINPQNPVKVNTVSIGFNIETLYSIRNYLFIGSQNGMYIYNIDQPENPTYVSEAQHFNACDPVVSNLSHAFVTLHSSSNCGNDLNVLQVYDVQNLENPVLIHQRNLTFPRGLALHEEYLLVCDDELKIFSIANPTEPELVHSLPKSYKDLIIYDGILYAFGENEIAQYGWTQDNFSDLYEISVMHY